MSRKSDRVHARPNSSRSAVNSLAILRREKHGECFTTADDTRPFDHFANPACP